LTVCPLSSVLCRLKKVDPPERGHVRAGLGIGAGVEGGRTRRPSLGDLGTRIRILVAPGRRPVHKNLQKFFAYDFSRLNDRPARRRVPMAKVAGDGGGG